MILWNLILSSPAAEPPNFSRDILPILSDNCFACHGPDAKSREADLRLDQQESALRTEKPIIRPGQSGDSELMKRILTADSEAVMPPPKSGRKLTAPQKEMLKSWIDSGAKWGKHWAFEPIRRPAIPSIENQKSKIKNPIDAFVLARLEKVGLAPSPEAAKHTLLRRVTLDLTGLPPTLEELDAFVADQSPDAYEAVVDRLLKSPRFGERMVWEWLDAARYADTNGYQGDPTRTMYFWRDWVINALNQNMPFDQFTIEQLAGDQLPNPTQPQLIATGFHRNHMINGEGGRIAEESRVDYVQDRVETTGTVWMGLTFNCCRCHDHKFDPLAQKEYYQLSAFFNSIEESGANDAGGLANPIITFAGPEQQKKLDDLRAAENGANTSRDQLDRKLRDSQAEWEKSLVVSGSAAEPQWTALPFDGLKSEAGAMLKKLEDNSILASGENPAKDSFEMVLKTKLSGLTAIQLEALPDESLISKGPGRADNGNFVLSELKLFLNDKPVELSAIRADYEQPTFPPANAVDGRNDTGWAIASEFGKPHVALFEPRASLAAIDGETTVRIRLEFQTIHVAHVLGRFRLSLTNSPVASLRPMPAAVREALKIAADKRNDAQQKAVTEFFLNNEPSLLAARRTADDAKKSREGFERSLPRTMVMRERPQPRETFILVRGAYDKFADKVSHGLPAVLPQPAEPATNRLALARWLMSPEHPLTARVSVNRYWQTFFGTGLVKTTEDFGVQGEKPSHPELLDWLAAEFADSREPIADSRDPFLSEQLANPRWNVKRLIRLIVTSATYRQASTQATAHRNPQASGVPEDPDNRLLARGPRYRLPSWMIRDQALAVSGLLVEKQGGPPVKGYQPPGIWEEATFGRIGYQPDTGEALYRRSLYQFWRRIVGPTIFFDVATRQTCQVKVARTNTPLHALVTLNDVTFVEAARALAQRVLLGPATDDAARLNELFRRCTSRHLKPNELAVLTRRVESLRELYAHDEPAAKKLIAVGASKASDKLPPADLAAFTSLASLLLNLDETISKE
ncbi:MAG: PSD1 and planctomycete cytochrome C domain-containing protein [Planctomycetaceae bacterium]